MIETVASEHRGLSRFDINTSVVHLLHRAGQCTGDSFVAHLTYWDLTPRQFAVLFAVGCQAGATQSTIVASTGIDRSTMVDVVRRLVSRGLLHRRRSRADTRCYLLSLTARGQAIVDGALPRAAHVDHQILTSLDPSDREAFVRNLEQIVRTLSASDRRTGAAAATRPAA